MADKQTILNNLLTSLERLSDHYSKLELNGLNPADRQTVLNDIGTIQTKLEQIIGTQDSLTSSEIEALRQEYQSLIDSFGSGNGSISYDDTLIKNSIDSLTSSINGLNFKDLSSSLKEIDLVSFLNDKNLVEIHNFFLQAFGSPDDYIFMSTGDSTSSAGYMKLQTLYSYILGLINCKYYDNSYPGQTAYDWLNNVDRNTLNLAVENSLGSDGSNTIMEFSMGINDFDGVNTRDDIYNLLKDCILSYKVLKPKSIVFLSSTIRTSSSSRDSLLLDVYNQLSIDLDLFHFKRYDSTSRLWDNPLFYYDHLHPNKFGARAWFYDMFNIIVPRLLKSNIVIEQYYDGVSRDSSYVLPINFLFGYFSTSSPLGAFKSDEYSLSVDKIPVIENQTLLVSHIGERKEYFFYDSNGDYISKGLLSGQNNNTYRLLIPNGVSFVSFNITLKYRTYSSTKDIFTAHLETLDSNIWLHSDYYLQTVNNSFTVNNFRNGLLLDSYGNIGILGQSLKIDVNNKMKWQ